MSRKDIRIGDKVRFLNDVGGGLVTRLDEKIIYVEDEIGFEVPMPIEELVVIERPEEAAPPRSETLRQTMNAGSAKAELADEAIMETDEEGFIDEHHDDSNPRLYFAFLDAAGPGVESPNVDLYFINDSNYQCLYMVAVMGEDGLARELFNGRLLPNTKEHLNKFSMAELDVNWQIQVLFYRKNKPFRFFEPVNETLKIKANKFFRDNSYKTNDFFHDKAVLIPVIKSELEIQMENLTKKETIHILKEKGEFAAAKPKEKTQKKSDIIEVDLHIHELLDDIRGLSNGDMLKVQTDRFYAVMEENIKNKGQKIVFIHGIGNGTLKHEVRRLLNTRYKKHNFQDASFREYGYGATMVII